jgi:hypothetical protein
MFQVLALAVGNCLQDCRQRVPGCSALQTRNTLHQSGAWWKAARSFDYLQNGLENEMRCWMHSLERYEYILACMIPARPIVHCQSYAVI